mgnify:CR=1 FL=1
MGTGKPTRLRNLRADPSADRITVAPLSSDTAAQTVWMLEKHRIQIAVWVPWHLRAEVARHHAQKHIQECCTRSCAQARAWVAVAAATRETAQSRAALPA